MHGQVLNKRGVEARDQESRVAELADSPENRGLCFDSCAQLAPRNDQVWTEDPETMRKFDARPTCLMAGVPSRIAKSVWHYRCHSRLPTPCSARNLPPYFELRFVEYLKKKVIACD